MEKLIITLGGDSRTSYPGNHYCPDQREIDAVARQYIDAFHAGAAITHIHGVRTVEDKMQPDGRQVSRMDQEGWKALNDAIRGQITPVMQFGVASARIAEKVKLMELGPDMMSVAFNAHDEYFNNDPNFVPKRMYAIHPQEELIEYAEAAEKFNVKLEVECFHTGGFWNLDFVRKQGHLEHAYVTLFLGWPGGTWTPPTEKALLYMVDHLPKNCVWNVSVMNPEKHWHLLSLAVMLGGNVRVGYEDNPYLTKGELAKNNALLVEKMVSIAANLGRDVATPEEARKILRLKQAA